QGHFLTVPETALPHSRRVRPCHDNNDLSPRPASTCGLNRANPYHPTLSADRTAHRRLGSIFLGWLRSRRPPTRCAPWPYPQQSPTTSQVRRPDTVAQQAVVANAHEPRWHDVQQEAADELHGFQRHYLLLIAVRVILPLEEDLIILDLHQSLVGDRHPV